MIFTIFLLYAYNRVYDGGYGLQFRYKSLYYDVRAADQCLHNAMRWNAPHKADNASRVNTYYVWKALSNDLNRQMHSTILDGVHCWNLSSCWSCDVNSCLRCVLIDGVLMRLLAVSLWRIKKSEVKRSRACIKILVWMFFFFLLTWNPYDFLLFHERKEGKAAIYREVQIL